MKSSGTTAVATSGAGNATLINAGDLSYNFLEIANEGPVAGFFSVDGGNVWGRIPAAAAATAPATVIWRGRSSQNVLIKRDGGTDMSAVYGFCDWDSTR